MPKITVLMPVWNAQAYVGQAIESVLQQSFPDFELLIVDDGSVDHTVDLIREYQDPRIRLVSREHDFIGTLNAGLDLSRGEYIARMDSDDVMHSERLKVQFRRMEEMPEMAVCGTWMQCFGEQCDIRVMKTVAGKVVNPVTALLERNILFHPTVMMRKAFLEEHSLRYKAYLRAEDYRLWGDIAECGGGFYVEPQVLLFYRVSQQQTSSQPGKRAGKLIRKELLEFLIRSSVNLTEEDKQKGMNLLEELVYFEEQGRIAEKDISELFRKFFFVIQEEMKE